MKTFIVAVPLFDKDMVVQAYKLETHNSDQLLGMAQSHMQLGESLLSRGLDLVEKIGVEPLTAGKPLFVDVNQYQLMMDIPACMSLPFHKLVCVLPKDTPDNEAVVDKCRELKKLGVRLAVGATPDNHIYNSLLHMASYMLFDLQSVHYEKQLKQLPVRVQPVVLSVDTLSEYEAVKAGVKNVLCGGQFYGIPISSDAEDVSPLKANALQLLRQVNEIDSDLIGIANTIERDPAISVALLRFINSPMIGTRQRIDSIRAAVAILGQKEIKRWVTVVVSMQLSSDKPGEITKLSLQRAKFAENLAALYAMRSQSSGLFMTGLFSLLDVMLDKSMKEAIAEISVDDKVYDALVNKDGEFYEVMEMVYAYERGDWDMVTINMIQHGVEPESISQVFIEALTWYKTLLDDLNEKI
ncbi:HDOD domain-containing protein [Christensenellaceae bacterium OttesenSCG-928-M15]|nr:HDOD domain-containing protein [Christensenellaceae bacterium OttesenSCG-928-M15]